MADKKLAERPCAQCQKSFPPTDGRQKYCSDKCRIERQEEQLEALNQRRRQCPNCGHILVPEDKRRKRWKKRSTEEQQLHMKRQNLAKKQEELEWLSRECRELESMLADTPADTNRAAP
jgi:hypothetical protein